MDSLACRCLSTSTLCIWNSAIFFHIFSVFHRRCHLCPQYAVAFNSSLFLSLRLLTIVCASHSCEFLIYVSNNRGKNVDSNKDSWNTHRTQWDDTQGPLLFWRWESMHTEYRACAKPFPMSLSPDPSILDRKTIDKTEDEWKYFSSTQSHRNALRAHTHTVCQPHWP